MRRFLALIAACTVLASCASRQPHPRDGEAARLAFQLREQTLTGLTEWDLAGKLSLDDGEDGGSGRLNWTVRGEFFEMNFRGALGRGSWRLNSGPGHAELYRSDGSYSRAGSVDELVRSEIGWKLPAGSLRWWALGLPAPGGAEALDLDAAGRVIAMRQDGWDIRYDRYRPFGDVELPGRMDAVRGRYRVKMAVSSWAVFPGGANE